MTTKHQKDDLNMDWKGTVRLITYNFAFHSEGEDDVQNVVNGILLEPHEGMVMADYIADIRSALSSSEDLSELLPHGPSDEEIRRFLQSVLEKLSDTK